MGITKKDLFNSEQNHLADIAKVLGHPARIAILDHLSSTAQCINSDLVEELGLAQATVSQHLRELRDIGLIKGTVEGAAMCYCIDQSKWDEVKNLFSAFFKSAQQNGVTC